MKRKTQATTLEWMMARNANGIRRIERLSWGRLNRIYHARRVTEAVRNAIRREARRCGYAPSTILSLNAWD